MSGSSFHIYVDLSAAEGDGKVERRYDDSLQKVCGRAAYDNGGVHVPIYEHIAASSVPEELKPYATRFTVRAKIYDKNGLRRRTGEYRLGDARAVLDTAFLMVGEGFEQRQVWYSDLSLEGKSFGDAQELYSRIRAGDISPERDYEGEQVAPFTIQGFGQMFRRWWSQRSLRRAAV